MSVIKKILVICLILAICLPMVEAVYAHSITLDPEDLITFPSIIWNGEGTITIDSSVSNYSLYYQAIPIPEEDYAQIKAAETTGKQELNTIEEACSQLSTELTELESIYNSAYEEYQQKLQDTSLQESAIETFRTAYETARTNYQNKEQQYNSKIDEYNSKVNEINERIKGLTPSYSDNNWTKSVDNEFKIDRTQFTGNLAHAVWAKLVTSDNQIYYEEATYTIEGTKEDVEVPKNTIENKKVKKTRLDVVQKASETKYLENDQGYITKTIVDSNPDEGEVTIELKLANTGKQQEETKEIYENTEVYLIISENIVNDNEKFTKCINNIEVLSNKILNSNSKTKIGIIGIKGPIRDTTEDEATGTLIWGENDEGNVNGKDTDAEIVCELSNNINTIKTAVQNMNSSKKRYYENFQAAIRLSNNSYSNNVNKILISLYDKVPDVAIDVKAMVQYGGFFGPTAEQAVKEKHDNIATYTKNEILNLETSNISFILLRPDDTSYDETWYSESTGEKILDFDGSPYVQKLYGTNENPTYGKTYPFNDSNIDTIITENIYQDVENIIQSGVINNVKMVDYFPDDIVNNFNFSYVGTPSVGTVSDSIKKEDNTITWEIGTLRRDETATVKYKLKIKDMQNAELLDKVIATNEKVVLTYKDMENKDYTVTLTSSPKIKLSEVKDSETDNQNGKTDNYSDPTVAPFSTLPNTGLGIVIIASVLLVIVTGIALLAKYHTFKDVK